MKIDARIHERLKRALASMDEERRPWYQYWQEIADYIMPRRFLASYQEIGGKAAQLRNPNILDGTATIAAETLAAGMMNGITSPARPWFRLRVSSVFEDGEIRRWLDDSQDRMMYVMAETNFYNAMATIYSDLSGFATAAMLIYEDEKDIFRCYNLALGEYYLLQDNRRIVNRLGRTFEWRVEQLVDEFGLDNCSRLVQENYKRGGAHLNTRFKIHHLIEPNYDDKLGVAKVHDFREIYWEAANGHPGEVLRVRGYRDWPAVTPRWATVGNDSYGVGPSMVALGDVKQLQHMTKRKAQGLDKMISPPMVADIQLRGRPTSLLPNGVTYVAGANSVGMKPAYQVNVPIAEMSNDILAVQERIRQFYHNDLFRMISQLDAVRTATEIDARREEKLVLLGPVLERFENEALDPALRRIFSIMLRRGYFLPPPAQLNAASLEIEYVSVLNDAQRAVGAAPLERYLGVLGNIAGVRPEVLEYPDWPELILSYADRIGVPEKANKTRRQIDEMLAKLDQQAQQQQAMEAVPIAADAAKNLSETEVGGGANALQQLLGG